MARPDLAAMNRARATHSMSRTPTYAVWRSMLARCMRPNRKDFKRYGARGITVCEAWLSFQKFVADMGVKPDGMTLDRERGGEGYGPTNCRWATPKQQARNRRSNVLLTFEDRTATVAEWAERTGLERKTLEYRIRAGWPVQRALTTPSTTNRKQNHV